MLNPYGNPIIIFPLGAGQEQSGVAVPIFLDEL
jgi:creatinine amidohydrolase/Fe(II)-dependent formamide hydrolase-like protein